MRASMLSTDSGLKSAVYAMVRVGGMLCMLCGFGSRPPPTRHIRSLCRPYRKASCSEQKTPRANRTSTKSARSNNMGRWEKMPLPAVPHTHHTHTCVAYASPKRRETEREARLGLLALILIHPRAYSVLKNRTSGKPQGGGTDPLGKGICLHQTAGTHMLCNSTNTKGDRCNDVGLVLLEHLQYIYS